MDEMGSGTCASSVGRSLHMHMGDIKQAPGIRPLAHMPYINGTRGMADKAYVAVSMQLITPRSPHASKDRPSRTSNSCTTCWLARQRPSRRPFMSKAWTSLATWAPPPPH